MGNDFDSCPIWTAEEARDESYGHIIRGMKISCFPKFGFVIYRCTYGNNAAWTELLTLIKQEAQTQIKKLGPGRDWLGTHLDWKIVEDSTLDGVSLEQVKSRFDRWSDEIVDESERTSMNVLRWLPRFNFCVVVDEKCLASMEKSKFKTEAGVDAVEKTPPMFVVLMRAKRRVPAWMGGGGSNQRRRIRRLSDGDSIDETEQDLEYEERIMREAEQQEEEEAEAEDDTLIEPHEATWMYVEPRYLLSLYNIMQADSGWGLFYVRPPGVYGRNEV
ncbi:hypothetical protein IFR04_016220 [Cadophora malorum]|uniref:Uncharacterized protein n=1 Tax=Cadophora malorum TaxID=108018 RepID=A0A8H7T1D9_9HELO|nr:hypothetical protein IFR04_016220 [Cadophora malorum]